MKRRPFVFGLAEDCKGYGIGVNANLNQSFSANLSPDPM